MAGSGGRVYLAADVSFPFQLNKRVQFFAASVARGLRVTVYSESDLIVPALAIIAAHPEGIGTTELSSLLRRQLNPSGEDLEPLLNRADDKFSQKVRNLKSHNSLEGTGLAIYEFGLWRITELGQKMADLGSEGLEIFQSLQETRF